MSIIRFDLTVRRFALADELVIWESIPKPKCYESLTCNFSNIKDNTTIYKHTGEVREHTIGIVYASLLVGMNAINHFNKSEWIYRLRVIKSHQMPIGRYATPSGIKNWWPSANDIEKHLGLKVIEAPSLNRLIWFSLLFAKSESSKTG